MPDVIEVQYKSDVSGLRATQKEFEDTGKAAKASAQTAQKEFKAAGDSIKSVGKDIAASIGVAFAVGKVIEFGKESLKAFIEAEEVANKLKFAITKIGVEGEAAFNKLIEQSEKLQSISIFSDDDIQKAQTQLSQFGLNSSQIEKLIPQILDLASATGQDLNSATQLSIQGINGLTRGLKAVGAEFKDTGDKTENLALLQEKLGKFAGATGEALETTGGKVKAFGNAVNNIQEDVGAFIVDAATPLVELLAFMVNGFESTGDSVDDFSDSIKLSDEEIKKLNTSVLEFSIVTQKNLLKTLQDAGGQNGAIAEVTKRIAELEAQLFKGKNAQESDESILGQIKELDTLLQSKYQLKVDGLSSADKKKILQDIIDVRTASNTNNLGRTQSGEADDEAAKQKALAAQKSIDDAKAKDHKKYLDDQADAENKNADKIDSDNLAGKKAFKELSDELDKEIAEGKRQTARDQIALDKETKKQQIELEKEKQKAIEQLQIDALGAASSIISTLSQINQNSNQQKINEAQEAADRQLSELQRQYDGELISKEQYEAKKGAINDEVRAREAQLKKEAFEFQKQASLIQAIIATAQGVATALTGDPYTVVARVAIAAAIGAAQIALIESQPTPKFEKGGKVKGRRHSAGGTIIEAEVDEYVVKRESANKNNSLLEAINSGRTDKFIFENYIAPALKAQQKKNTELKQQSFADNLAKSIMINQGNFKDSNLLESLKQSRRNDREIAIFLSKELKGSNFNRRKW